MAETRTTDTSTDADTERTVAIAAGTLQMTLINNSDHAFKWSGVSGRSGADRILPARTVQKHISIPPNIYWQTGYVGDKLIIELI